MGDGTFRDATGPSGLGFAGFCHGVIVGDIDNDGDADVLLANYGPNVLYLNNGDGTFTDISHSAGIDRPGWSSGGAVLDYDNDGDLDVYLANYGEWSLPGTTASAETSEERPAILLAPEDPDDQTHPVPQQRRPDLHGRDRRGGVGPATATASASSRRTSTRDGPSTSHRQRHVPQLRLPQQGTAPSRTRPNRRAPPSTGRRQAHSGMGSMPRTSTATAGPT
jgi:hypothetical protein